MVKQYRKLKDSALHLNSLRKFVTNKTFINAVRTEFKLKILNQPPVGNVLILSPHPDDDVFGCGGTIKLHIENNDSVTVLYLTNGKDEVRKKEAKKACQLLGVNNSVFWNYNDDQIVVNNKTINVLEKIFIEVKPQTIYVPAFTDPHPDHLKTAQLLQALLKKHKFTGLIFSYEVWQPVYANRLIKIDSVIKSKVEAIEAHQSQLKDRLYQKAILGLNQYRAGMYRIGKYAEGFFVCNRELYLELMK